MPAGGPARYLLPETTDLSTGLVAVHHVHEELQSLDRPGLIDQCLLEVGGPAVTAVAPHERQPLSPGAGRARANAEAPHVVRRLGDLACRVEHVGVRRLIGE